MTEQIYQPGDKVNWKWTSPGGYNYSIWVAGVVVRVTKSRVRIRVAQKIAGVWVQEERSVKPDRLRPRTEFVPAVDEVDV